MEKTKENNLYQNIIIVLGNCFYNDAFKATVIHSIPFKKHVVNEIGSLLALEKEFNCSYKNKKYSVIFAQIIANLLNEVETIEKRVESYAQLDESLLDFTNFVSQELSISKASLKNEAVNLDEPSLIATAEFDTSKARKIAEEAQAQKTSHTATPNQKNDVRDSVQAKVKQNSAFGGGFAGGAGASGANQGPPPGMGGFGSFVNPMTGTNFPLHPRLDQRFYPYTHKPKFIKHFKIGLGAFAILVSSFLLILIIVALSKHITLTPPDDKKYFLQANSGSNKGALDPEWGTKYGKTGYDAKSSILLTLNPIGGYGFLTGFLVIIPGIWLGYSMFATPRMHRERFVLSNMAVGFNLVFLAITLYYSISFITPNFLSNTVKSLYYLPSGYDQKTFNEIVQFLTGEIDKSPIYKSIFSAMIAANVLIGGLVITLLVALFINPKVDRNKLMRADQEYQRSVAAQFRNEKYEIDPKIYDQDLIDIIEKEQNPPPSHPKEPK